MCFVARGVDFIVRNWLKSDADAVCHHFNAFACSLSTDGNQLRFSHLTSKSGQIELKVEGSVVIIC